jgi:hypothetical protein
MGDDSAMNFEGVSVFFARIFCKFLFETFSAIPRTNFGENPFHTVG